MAAPFLLLLLLVASGGAVGGEDGVGLPHLQLHGVEDSGRGRASDALPHGLVDYLKLTQGCGRFGALLATTANASDIFCQRIVSGGLTVFCPEDLALAAFDRKFSNMSAADLLAVVLYHGTAGYYGREQLAAFDSVSVRTLAVDPATNKSHVLTVRDDGDTVWLWSAPPSRGSGGAARVTTEVPSGESPIALYVVDSVLLPEYLRQHLEDGDEAAAGTSRGGYLGWLDWSIPVWAKLCIIVPTIIGSVAGLINPDYSCFDDLTIRVGNFMCMLYGSYMLLWNSEI